MRAVYRLAARPLVVPRDVAWSPSRDTVGYSGSISVLAGMHWHEVPPDRLLPFVDALVSVAAPMCVVGLTGAMLHFMWASQH